MKADIPTDLFFPHIVSRALTRLKQQLQRDYERAYPQLSEIIHLVLDEEETKARELSVFPHLLLPDLVEAHIANLNLPTAETKHESVFTPHLFEEIDAHEPAFAFCG